MDEDIIVTLKRSNDLLMTFGNDYSDVFLPAIDEIERLRKTLEEIGDYNRHGWTMQTFMARVALRRKSDG